MTSSEQDGPIFDMLDLRKETSGEKNIYIGFSL
jgi:hypothetical protein